MAEWLAPALSLALLMLGLYCLLSRRRVIKQVIGLSIMLQGALLGIVDAGRVIEQPAMAQGMVISALLVETVVMAIVLALIVNVYRYHPEGLIDDLDQLKG
ncbi:MAG: NADH-quinone oxidoreductase subunit K [Chloroflexi bacterium]|jgi:NADH:ubiquinone oxidoreductase subunit K|nr:NADH-quinone oxidoreductase subunit K [Chloroflexota bacterium]